MLETWRLAGSIAEISWLAMVRKVTAVKITVLKSVTSLQVALQAMSHNISSRRAGMVSMTVPPQGREEPALNLAHQEYVK